MACWRNGLILVGTVGEFLRKATLWLADKKPIRNVVDWAVNFSLWPVHFTTACCGVEFAHTSAPRFDAERFGVLPFIASRQCNLLLIEGTLTRKMGRAAQVVYAQMPEP